MVMMIDYNGMWQMVMKWFKFSVHDEIFALNNSNVQYLHLNKVDPLTAVQKCICDSSSYCPCLYRVVLWLWCHNITSYRERGAYEIAPLPIGQYLFTL